MRMEVTPSHAASLDVALDELVLGEMRIGGATVSEDAEMDDEADVRAIPALGSRVGTKPSPLRSAWLPMR